MTELKPCPFCGGKARIMLEEEDRPDDSFHNVYCTGCGVQFWVKSKSQAIAAWNRRSDAVPVVRGEWEVAIGYDPNKKVQCQNCYKMAYEPTPYCPNCGARMEDRP